MIILLTVLLLFSGSIVTPEADSLDINSPKKQSIFEKIQLDSLAKGHITFHTQSIIDSLTAIYIRQSDKTSVFSGYRIQIHTENSFGANIEQLKQMRNDFEIAFPEIPAYLKYIDPDFKIRVGNFTSRLEAVAVLAKIKKNYPASYVVKTSISIHELMRVPMQDIKTDSLDLTPNQIKPIFKP